MTKTRVLFAGEYSRLNTGFAIYIRNVLEQLAKSDKYELAEHASYCCIAVDNQQGQEVLNEEALNLPWKVYPNAPHGKDEQKLYDTDVRNAYGKWRFDRVCLDFKPDIVLTCRDQWFDDHIFTSWYRPYYAHIALAPVDSSPQQVNWLESFAQADRILTFTKWGKEALDYEGGGIINTVGDAPICVTPDFKPMDKAALKKQFGLNKDSIIIGTVMRNQKRKLYPDLIEQFKVLLDKLPKHIADKTYLLLYTCYPDLGWDLPNIINDFGMTSKIVVAYQCQFCSHYFLSTFKDARTNCEKCGNYACTMPNVRKGLTNTELATIYNIMDIYVQWANCEGFGASPIEAGACGVPAIMLDYSAMSEVGKNLNAYMVEPLSLMKEVETAAYRGIPDGTALTDLLSRLLQQSPDFLKKRGQKALEGAQKFYANWSIPAKTWMEAIDSIVPHNLQGKWNAPPNLIRQVPEIPAFKSNNDFVKWCILNVASDPDLLFSKKHIDWVSDLNIGANVYQDLAGLRSLKHESITRKEVFNLIKKMREDRNMMEEFRCGLRQLNPLNWLEFAHKSGQGKNEKN